MARRPDACLGVLATGSLDTGIAGAVPSGAYHFRMRAANSFGSSAPSNEVVLVVPQAAAADPGASDTRVTPGAQPRQDA